MDFDELNYAMAESNTRARRGRRSAWIGFVVTTALVAVFVLLFTTADPCSGMMCPRFKAPPSPNLADVTLGVGLAGLAVGLIWMWRIVRADRDPDARSSRLHRP